MLSSLVALVAILFALPLAARPAAAATAARMPVPWWPVSCPARSADGTADDYLSGRLCPLPDFAVLAGEAPVGLRAGGVTLVGELAGECSWFPDAGPFWDFQVPCKGHDYCWDLLRAQRRWPGRYQRVTKARCDAMLLEASLTHCSTRRAWRTMCRLQARTVYAAVIPFRPRP
ncbi:MAG TPA: hypothetical protein VF855_01150 [Acidimicrobiales bacterium]